MNKINVALWKYLLYLPCSDPKSAYEKVRVFCSVLRISLTLTPCVGILNKIESIVD